MKQQNSIKIFEDKKVRTLWDAEKEKWYFSIVDVIGILTDSPNPRKYWSVLKTRLKAEGSQLATNCSQLKKENLRDNMTNTELILNMLAEASTKDISVATNPKDFEESKKVAKQGGNVAKVARKELEAKTGKSVVTPLNAKKLLNKRDTPKKLGPKK
ncbi:MAG TPA: hypothetical protein PKI13_07090 [Bacteroidaceae bacterium]|jgi:hypothetical protein|nr:hypothetical protein [Bacteroidaceae bacterium]HQL26625.1 hypothetical protein [Bacteroidaceae bacterium]